MSVRVSTKVDRVYAIEVKKRGKEFVLRVDMEEEGTFSSVDAALGYLQEQADETNETFKPAVHRRGQGIITPRSIGQS